jgi:hypothetical protein
MDKDEQNADTNRISRLGELAKSGVVVGHSSYFNNLITIYDKVGKLTARERARVDLFLAARGK